MKITPLSRMPRLPRLCYPRPSWMPAPPGITADQLGTWQATFQDIANERLATSGERAQLLTGTIAGS